MGRLDQGVGEPKNHDAVNISTDTVVLPKKIRPEKGQIQKIGTIFHFYLLVVYKGILKEKCMFLSIPSSVHFITI